MTIWLVKLSNQFIKFLTNNLVRQTNQFVKILTNDCLVRQTNYRLNKETTIKRL